MVLTADAIVTDILRREGGASTTNHPNDRGGVTRYGITQDAWAVYAARNDLPASVTLIDEPTARDFYLAVHVEPYRWVENDNVWALLADCSANHGKSRTVRWLQAALRIKQDGVIGSLTVHSYRLLDADTVYVRVLRDRFKFYARIATDQTPDPDAVFLRGWINRACEFIR